MEVHCQSCLEVVAPVARGGERRKRGGRSTLMAALECERHLAKAWALGLKHSAALATC